MTRLDANSRLGTTSVSYTHLDVYKRQVNAPDGIFLRTGPGTSFPSVGAAALGDSGTLIGISQDRAWYVVEAPGLPDGRVWVAAAFVDAANADNLPTVPTPALPNALVGQTWQWTGTIAGTQALTVADPSRYAITFAADGTASIKADCNMVTAQYTCLLYTSRCV